MSNWMFRAVTASLCLAELAALIWAVAPRGSRSGIYATNLLAGGFVLVFLLGELPGELRSLTAGEGEFDLLDIDSYKTSLLCLVELVVLPAAAMALFGRRVPGLLIWLGFVVNAGLSTLLLFFAFFFEFRCCGYL